MCNVLVVNELAVYRRVKNDCLCLVKRMMFNMLRNTPCGTRCLKKALVGSGRQVRRDGSGGTGQEGRVERTGQWDRSETGQEDRSGGTGREDWSVGQVGDRSGGQVRGRVMRTCQGTGHEDVSVRQVRRDEAIYFSQSLSDL